MCVFSAGSHDLAKEVHVSSFLVDVTENMWKFGLCFVSISCVSVDLVIYLVILCLIISIINVSIFVFIKRQLERIEREKALSSHAMNN